MIIRIIRHAETSANHGGQLSCDDSELLNENGLRQAKELSGYLTQHTFRQILVSSLPRAKQTIQPYLDSGPFGYTSLPELVEGCYNIDNEAPINEQWELRRDPLGDFRGRVQAFVERIKLMTGDGEVLVVTHGHFIREFLNMLADSHNYLRWPIDNCAETALDIGEDIKVLHVNKAVI